MEPSWPKQSPGGAVLATAITNPKDALAAGASVVGTGINATAQHVVKPISQKVADDTGGIVWLLLGIVLTSGGIWLVMQKWSISKKESGRNPYHLQRDQSKNLGRLR